MRGRVPVALDNQGGTDAGILSEINTIVLKVAKKNIFNTF